MRELLNQAMLMLAGKGAIFVGQGVRYDGVWTYDSLDGVPEEQRIEMPVAEELQLGICTGLAMQGFLPVCIYPRFDFLLRAMDQLVNHLDKINQMSQGQWNPKVIIRTRVGTRTPLDAGPQHTQDHSCSVATMLTSIVVAKINCPNEIEGTYRDAAERDGSTLVVEAMP